MINPTSSLTTKYSNENPTGPVQAISWQKDQPYFAATTWDSDTRVYEVAADEIKHLRLQQIIGHEYPLLDLAWKSSTEGTAQLFGGAIDGSVIKMDLISGKSNAIGSHEKAVKKIFWVEEMGVLMTYSYDATIKLWDLRADKYQKEYVFPSKIIAGDFLFPNIAVVCGTSDTIVCSIKSEKILENQSYKINPCSI